MNTTTLGDFPESKPEGMFRAVTFPQLLVMDEPTGDGRLLDSAGAGVRELPRPIYFQKTQAEGHLGAVAVGSLSEVTFTEGDDGRKIASGRGWLMDTAEGREAAQYISTKTIFHNSVDLNDVKVTFELIDSGDDLDLQFRFTDWRIGGTTLVGSPAFADAHAAMSEEETTASLIVEADSVIGYDWNEPDELVADGGFIAAWADFHIPEPDHRQKIVVDADGRVYGHLAIWNEPHEGFPNRLRYPPRPGDGYASFNQPGPLTEHGQVETGPIFLLGGHPKKPLGDMDPYAAYGGVENCWADVRVSAGVHGPWLSGRVRPNVDDDMLYAARASRISGHWVGDRLRAITSCNVEGFPVGGSGVIGEAVIRDGEVLELVASYQGDEPDDSNNPILWSELSELAAEIAPLLGFTETTDIEIGETWTAEEVADAVVKRLNETRFGTISYGSGTMSGTLRMEPPAVFVPEPTDADVTAMADYRPAEPEAPSENDLLEIEQLLID